MEKTRKKPLFSVLIANYNCGKFINECIQSVVRQTYDNWEIILVDDCSTDDSLMLISSISNELGKRMHVYHNDRNRGCTFTKSECIKFSNGDLCGFLDADDLLTPNAIESMVRAYKYDNISIVSSRYYVVDEKLNIIGKNRLLKLNNISYLEGRDYSPEHFVSFRRDAYMKTKGLDVTHEYGDDQELYLLLEEVGEWVVLDEFLYYYRQHNNSTCHNFTYDCYFWNIIDRYEACIRRGIDVKNVALLDFFKVLEEYGCMIEYETEKRIRSTKTYTMGNRIIKPIMWLKKFRK